MDFLSLLIFSGLATYRFQATQGTDNPFICTNITMGWTYNFDLPAPAVPAQCRKTESIFSIDIPYKDIHDTMNDVFVVYLVKLYEQELKH